MIHDGYGDIIDVLSYSIGEYVDLLMNAIYNLFKILILQVDSNGNVIGLNFLGTFITCIILLYVVVWLISFLVNAFVFGKTKKDLPTYSDIENETYWENQFNKTKNLKRSVYARDQMMKYRARNEERVMNAIKQKEIQDMKAWKLEKQLKLYRKYKKYDK